MSSVFGEIQLKLENDLSVVEFDHAILKPNFFISSEVMHQSCITEERTWAKDIHFSEFTIIDFLFQYADPAAKAEELFALEDGKYLFTPFNMLWSKNVLILNVEVKPIEGAAVYENFDVAYITMIAADPGTLGDYMKDKAGNRYKTKSGKYIRRKIRGI